MLRAYIIIFALSAAIALLPATAGRIFVDYGVAVDTAYAGVVYCSNGQSVRSVEECPPPKNVPRTGKASKAFYDKCTWLPFPKGIVRKPIVFFHHSADDDCIGVLWRKRCPICEDWVANKRGPVNGPARGASHVWRLHNNSGGISVPKNRLAEIRRTAGWCDLGTTGKYDSNHF